MTLLDEGTQHKIVQNLVSRGVLGEGRTSIFAPSYETTVAFQLLRVQVCLKLRLNCIDD